MNISVVIITKNEAHIIANTLQSLQHVFTDIVVVDSGSTDGTVAICKEFNATVIETDWLGYGQTKNIGITAAKNEWIFSLDADEAIDYELQQSLQQLVLSNAKEVFKVRLINFFCGKRIRFGEWGFDKHIRLFNRQVAKWNTAEVHESLVYADKVKISTIKGNILHYTVQDRDEYSAKTDKYARMNATKYMAEGKKAGFIKLYFSPVFSFIQHYIFRLGFLDGREGLLIAKTTAYYTFLKYRYLKELNRNKK